MYFRYDLKALASVTAETASQGSTRLLESDLPAKTAAYILYRINVEALKDQQKLELRISTIRGVTTQALDDNNPLKCIFRSMDTEGYIVFLENVTQLHLTSDDKKFRAKIHPKTINGKSITVLTIEW